jgi:hypothetical protein
VSSVPQGLRYLMGPVGSGGQGSSASSCSSCLKRFLEARLGRSHRRQGGRHWSSMLCRGQGGHGGAAGAWSPRISPCHHQGRPHLQQEGSHKVRGDHAQKQQLEAGVLDVPQP